MALSDILGSAVSGLSAAQAGLRSVSNNIANVNTPGYARERVDLSTAVVGGRTQGVRVGEPTRVADRFLESNVWRRAGEFGRADIVSSYLDRLQALLGQPGAQSGLPARLDAVTAAAVAMTGSMDAANTGAVFTGAVQDAIDSMRQVSADADTLRGEVEGQVGTTVTRINDLLQRIGALNDSVVRLQGLGQSISGTADQRASAIEELSGLLSLNSRTQSDGRITLETTGGQVLLDRVPRRLSYPQTGEGVSQPVYAPIEIRFVQPDGTPGAATGETLDSVSAGGRLGGLLDLRDRALPAFADQVGTLFEGLARALNAASDAGSTVPPPTRLDGRATGLVGTDRAGFTGTAYFAVVGNDGILAARATVDFDALPVGATMDDVLAAINTGLNGAATASLADGRFSLVSNTAGAGVVVAQDAGAPAMRGGVGLAQFLGLNDLVQSDRALVPSGMTAADPHGFDTGQTMRIILRDANGRELASDSWTAQAGGSFGDMRDTLNAGPLGDYGAFTLDDLGRMRFQPVTAAMGARLSIPSDSTDRFGAGMSLSNLFGLSPADNVSGGAVRADMLADPRALPLAVFDAGAAVGQRALVPGDIGGATAFVDGLSTAVDLGDAGLVSVDGYAAVTLGRVGTDAAQAQGRLDDATARRDDAISRRDSFSGVNIDEELSQMVVLQNSYSASARVITTASEMFDTLIAMVR